jgi:hypothetical protein
MKIVGVINHYNRSHMVHHVIDMMSACKLITHILVYDDGSKEHEREELVMLCRSRPKVELNLMHHHGKQKYWLLTDNIYQRLANLEWDMVLHMPDDMVPVDNMVEELLRVWESIPDPRKICINPMKDYRASNWNGYKRTLREFNGVQVNQVGWVDMMYLAPRKYMHCLQFSVHPVIRNWSAQPQLGSGVGQQITERLERQGTFWQVEKSLVEHIGDESVMNQQLRQTQPIKSI